jgi:hypothetical protein
MNNQTMNEKTTMNEQTTMKEQTNDEWQTRTSDEPTMNEWMINERR